MFCENSQLIEQLLIEARDDINHAGAEFLKAILIRLEPGRILSWQWTSGIWHRDVIVA
jgi:hypothetical protein